MIFGLNWTWNSSQELGLLGFDEGKKDQQGTYFRFGQNDPIYKKTSLVF